ncbi:MAG: hypothetical protein ISS72_10570 [Candidatus Brocadiae bacterium]|nr:hypothetical protein [Candidatus Brocadiia bacterium]
MKRLIPGVVVWVAVVASAARADKIVLKSGKVLIGQIVAESEERIALRVSPSISMEVRRSEVSQIVREEGGVRARLGQPPVAPPDATPPEIKQNRRKLVCFAQVHGPIESDLMVDAVRRSCARAVHQKAELVVFEIDTPGGRLDRMLEIVALIERLHPIPTVAYVSGGPSGGAYSAGAVLAMACGETYMAPGTAIGAAAPVAVTGKKTAVDEKHVSAVRAKMRSLAQKNGYPPKVAAAMVDAQIEIREATINGKATFLSVATPTAAAPAPEAPAAEAPKVELGDWVTERGKLLTLTAVEAKRYEIATALAASRGDLVDLLGFTGCTVGDLKTDEGFEELLEGRRRQLQKLDGKIAAYHARALALDPAKFRYARHEKSHGIFRLGDFLDEGRQWRRRSSACIKLTDGCLEACRKKLAMALDHPELNIQTAGVKAMMPGLVALREKVAGSYYLKGSER